MINMMIGLLKVVKEELEKISCKIRDQEVTPRLEASLQENFLTKLHVLFYKGLKTVKGDEFQIAVIYDKRQISCSQLFSRRRKCAVLRGDCGRPVNACSTRGVVPVDASSGDAYPGRTTHSCATPVMTMTMTMTHSEKSDIRQ